MPSTNLASVKQQYATLLTLRRQALIDLLDTRELFTALDNAVKEFRTDIYSS